MEVNSQNITPANKVDGHVFFLCVKSLMAKWLEQVSQWHGMYNHDLEVMDLNPGRVELQEKSYFNQKYL